MHQWTKKKDTLRDLYCSEETLIKARELLQSDEQTEEAFLGAQGILMLHGLI